MDKPTPPTVGYLKLTIGLLLLYNFHSHTTQAAFPLERDIAELSGISPPKQWICFMERVARMCLNDIKTKEYMTLTDTLKCMTKKDSSRCLHWYHTWGSFDCALFHISPNVLKYSVRHSDGSIGIQIFVHRQFSHNITVVDVRRYQRKIPYFLVMGNEYTGKNFSTLLSSESSMKIYFLKNTVIEFGVAQILHATNHRKIEANTMYIPWGYFLATCFRIQVDIRARLALDNITCSTCKLIVYDGPNEMLPIILKIDKERFQRVLASTFQVFAVVIDKRDHQQALLTYTPIYKTETVFNLSIEEHHQQRFDNHTWCYGHSWSARLCVYTFYTSTMSKIRLAITDLNLQGEYDHRDITFKAGVGVADHLQGATGNLFELEGVLLDGGYWYFEIVSVGNKMHVLIFVYSAFASLTLTFSVSTTNCTILLAIKNYISYSGYVAPTDHTLHDFQISQPLGTSFEHDGCFRFQFIAFLDIFRVRFPAETTAYVIRLGSSHCYEEVIIAPINSPSFPKKSGNIYSIDSMTVYACRNSVINIRMKLLPCTMPCKFILDQGQCDRAHGSKKVIYDNYEHSTCDICKNYYSGCTPVLGIPLRRNASFTLRIKSDICLSACVRIVDYKSSGSVTPTMSFTIPGDMLTIPALNTVNTIILLTSMCDIEIPFGAIEYNPPVFDIESVTPYEVKTAFWGGVLYRRLSQLPSVTWERAAQSCSEAGGSLLTIHSSAEYQFLEDTFLQARDTSLLYVGWRREVMCIVCKIYMWPLKCH